MSVENYLQYGVDTASFSNEAANRIRTALMETRHPLDVVVVELGIMQEDVLAKLFSGYLEVPVQADPMGQADPVMSDRLGQD